MAAGEGVAHLLRVGQHEGALAQGMEMQGVAALGVPVKPHGRQEITEALHHQKLLGTLASVKGRPHFVITALVECKRLVAVGDIELAADGVKGLLIGPIEVEQGIIRVE